MAKDAKYIYRMSYRHMYIYDKTHIRPYELELTYTLCGIDIRSYYE